MDDELLDAMRRETSLFVERRLQEDRSILDFIDAPFTFVNGPLARHYGIPGVDGEEFRRVELDGEQRSGIVTQGAILTVSSYPTRTSPPGARQVGAREPARRRSAAASAGCAGAGRAANSARLSSLRQRLEQHRKDPSCAACHNQMDPIGFGLESYDAVGAWRTRTASCRRYFRTLPDGRSFRGAKDLKKILRSQSDAFARNFTEKLLTFALGRGLEAYDRRAVDEIVQQGGRRTITGSRRSCSGSSRAAVSDAKGGGGR